MPYRQIPLVTGEYYHIYNRGLEKQKIFTKDRDYLIFLKTLLYYQIQSPKPRFSIYRQSKTFPIDQSKKIVDILCFCLMPNHFHLLIKQTVDGGITELMRKFIHSFTNYRNLKYSRQGPRFQGVFKAVHIESDEQLIHLSRYIHLNPYVSGITEDLESYPWSSFGDYLNTKENNIVKRDEIMGFFKTADDYKQFVYDQADYGRTLELLKHSTIDIDEEQ